MCDCVNCRGIECSIVCGSASKESRGESIWRGYSVQEEEGVAEGTMDIGLDGSSRGELWPCGGRCCLVFCLVGPLAFAVWLAVITGRGGSVRTSALQMPLPSRPGAPSQ